MTVFQRNAAGTFLRNAAGTRNAPIDPDPDPGTGTEHEVQGDSPVPLVITGEFQVYEHNLGNFTSYNPAFLVETLPFESVVLFDEGLEAVLRTLFSAPTQYEGHWRLIGASGYSEVLESDTEASHPGWDYHSDDWWPAGPLVSSLGSSGGQVTLEGGFGTTGSPIGWTGGASHGPYRGVVMQLRDNADTLRLVLWAGVTASSFGGAAPNPGGKAIRCEFTVTIG